MRAAFASEALLLRRRGAPYVLGASWMLMIAAFAFVVPYIVYLALDPAANPERDELLRVVLPARLDQTAVSSYPMFGGAIMLILGVLISGSEDRWGTWKVRFTQGPSRASVIAAKFAAGAIAATLVALAAMVAAAVASGAIALIAGQPMMWPDAGALARSAGSAALISITWTSVGTALGVICRGTSTAIAIGLIWTLVVENAVAAVTGMVEVLEPVRSVLLSSASGSLVASMGARTQSDGGTPGVVDVLSGPAAVLVLIAYSVAAFLISLRLVRSRDVM